MTEITNAKKPSIKKGASVKLLVGKKGDRGRIFTVTKVDGDRVFLEGYKVLARARRINAQNTQNYANAHQSIHISNVSIAE